MSQGPITPRPIGRPSAAAPTGELPPGQVPPGGGLPPGGDGPGPVVPVPPNGGNRSGLLVTAAVVLALLFLGGIVYFATHRGSPSSTAIATPSPTPLVTSTPIPTPTPTDTPPPTPAPTPTPPPAPTPAPPTPAPKPACPSAPPPPLMPGTGSYTGVDASGCGAGTAPASGSFNVPSGWDIAYAYTCDGSTGASGMRPSITFTAHDTDTNTDLAGVTGQGPYGSAVSSGSGDNPVAPAGNYVIKVSLPYPTDNQCNWHFRIYRGAGN